MCLIDKEMKKYILLFLMGLTSVFVMGQTNYYVSTTGNNSNDGGISSPWLTIQYGLNQMLSGDVLNLETGSYNEKISIPTSGIVLKNKIGALPIIDGTGLTSQTSIVEIYDVSNFTMEGIEIQNNIMQDAQGIVIENNCQNITIQNCKIHDIHFSANVNASVNANTNAQGIIVYGSDANNSITNLNILNNEVYDCRLGFSEGVAVNGNVDGFEVSGNLVHDLTNIGLDFIGFEGTSSNSANDQARNGLVKNNIVYNCIAAYATSGGIYIDGGKSIIVENNTAYHNGYGIEVGCENVGKATEDIIVRNNIFYDNEVSALALGGYAYPSGSGKVINSTFRNNTCYKNDFSNQGVGEMYLSYTENCIIENNIFYLTNQNSVLYQDGTPQNLNLNYNVYFTDASLSNIEFDYDGNGYTGLSNFSSSTNNDINSITVNPNFVVASISNPDFHLQQNSPAINVGNPSYVAAIGETDLDGENRTNGIVDCGVDESYDTLSIDSVNLENMTLYPSPTSDNIIVPDEFLNANYVIFAMNGQQVLSGKISSNTINLLQLTNGVLFVKIIEEKSKKHYQFKLIKNN